MDTTTPPWPRSASTLAKKYSTSSALALTARLFFQGDNKGRVEK
jgi:hypothetical protein